MSQSAWDDMREDARAFARQNPTAGHTLFYALPGEWPGGEPVYSSLERMNATPAALLGRFLRPQDLARKKLHPLHTRIINGTFATEHGNAACLLWDQSGNSAPDTGDTWIRLLKTLYRLSGEEWSGSVEIGLVVDNPIRWPILHRLAWEGRKDTAYRCDVAWRALRKSTPEYECWIVETPPLRDDFGTDATTAQRQAAENKHKGVNKELVDDPWALAGWWCSTVYPAGAALVSAVDFLRTEKNSGGSGDDAKPPALPAASAEHALTADHENILKVLGKNPKKCMLVIDVTSNGKIRNRETAGRLLTELARFGLVNRPHGNKKGYALTDEGKKRLEDITQAQMPT